MLCTLYLINTLPVQVARLAFAIGILVSISVFGDACGALLGTVRHRGMETGISEASKRVSIFSFATQGGKQVSFYFRQGNWVQAQDAQIRFPAG